MSRISWFCQSRDRRYHGCSILKVIKGNIPNTPNTSIHQYISAIYFLISHFHHCYMQTRAKTVPARQDHPPLKSCRSVNNYERLNHIEEGTYGIVFRARCKETGEIVALKRLKLEEEKYGFPITSLREIHSLLICQHPHIVNVREIVVGDTLNQIYIVMDFVEHDLKTLMHTMPEPFLISEVKTLLKQLLEATAHAHSNWILHRDLKASNLLMNNRGQIKVADFGMARRYADPVDEMTQLVVTLWYR